MKIVLKDEEIPKEFWESFNSFCECSNVLSYQEVYVEEENPSVLFVEFVAEDWDGYVYSDYWEYWVD